MAPKKKTLTGMSQADLKLAGATTLYDLEALNSLKSSLRKDYGDDAAVDTEDFVTSFIPTGIDALDYYLGGGIPVGRLTEVAGREGTGKSSFGIHMLGVVQRMGGLCGLIDTEAGGAGDKFRFDHFGVDPERCIISDEDKAEKIFGIIEKVAAHIVKNNIKVPSLLVVDSVAGITSAKELEADMSQAQYPVTPKMISTGIKRTKKLCKESNLSVIFVNQTRVKMGGMTNAFTGPELTTPGGDALKFQAITRLLMERGATLVDANKNPMGHVIKTKIIKCKTSAALNRTLPMAFYYDRKEFYNPKIVWDILNTDKVFGKDAWKTAVLPDGSEKRFNSESTFFELFESSEENRQHFLGMMRNVFNTNLNFGSTDESNESVTDADSTNDTVLED